MPMKFNDDFLSQLLRQLCRNPTTAIEECQEEYEKVEALYEYSAHTLIGFLCGYVETISGSPEQKRELMEHKRWPNHRPKANAVTLAATRFALQAWDTKSERYERARIYSKVIDHCRRIDLKPDEVPEYLAKKKIAGVLKVLEVQGTATQQEGRGTASPRGTEQPAPRAVTKRTEADERVEGRVLLRPEDKELVPVKGSDDRVRIRDTSDIERRRHNFVFDDQDEDDEITPSRPIEIDEEDDIYFSAGPHFSKFGRVKVGEDIMVKLRRVRDREGRWQFQAISAEVVHDEGDELLH